MFRLYQVRQHDGDVQRQNHCTKCSEEWESSLSEVQIAAGDVLVIYTDGVSEADNSNGEEFGEKRLLEIIRRYLCVPVPLILDAILRGALEFSGGEGTMRDDLTLVVARGR